MLFYVINIFESILSCFIWTRSILGLNCHKWEKCLFILLCITVVIIGFTSWITCCPSICCKIPSLSAAPVILTVNPYNKMRHARSFLICKPFDASASATGYIPFAVFLTLLKPHESLLLISLKTEYYLLLLF